MLNALRLQTSTPARLHCSSEKSCAVGLARRQLDLQCTLGRHLASFRFKCTSATASDQSCISHLTSAVGSPSAVFYTVEPNSSPHSISELRRLRCCHFCDMVLLLRNQPFCVSHIPLPIQAFKRAAESLEKLMDTAKEELPSTMAAVRLSGMELSDLTMELSDIGQEITQGVWSSTQAVRIAEERLRCLTNFIPTVTMQEVARNTDQTTQPVLARIARGLREGIVQGRGVLRMLFMLAQYSRTLRNFFRYRAKVQ